MKTAPVTCWLLLGIPRYWEVPRRCTTYIKYKYVDHESPCSQDLGGEAGTASRGARAHVAPLHQPRKPPRRDPLGSPVEQQLLCFPSQLYHPMGSSPPFATC